MDLPRRIALPSSQPLASHLVIVPVVGMKDQDRGGEARRGDAVRKYTQVLRTVSVFLYGEITLANFRDGDDVVKRTLLLANREAPFIYDLMVEFFGGGDAVDALHKFLDMI